LFVNSSSSIKKKKKALFMFNCLENKLSISSIIKQAKYKHNNVFVNMKTRFNYM